MATLREYFETDFANTIRLNLEIQFNSERFDAVFCCDFTAHASFLAVYDPGTARTAGHFKDLIKSIRYSVSPFLFTGRIGLPAAKTFPGSLRVVNSSPVVTVAYKFHGDGSEQSALAVPLTGRLFLYAATQLSLDEISQIQKDAESQQHLVQFRSTEYVNWRTMNETPLAFISHDSRDKDLVARPIAIALQRWLCPVWYDEFSLKVGDHLRESIETGLKNCKKCILVLSDNFFSNSGWTKKEFDSIFTREILEDARLVLPVWVGVSKEQVYDYSPSLLNVVGLDWKAIGQDEVCRRLHRAIVD